MNNSGTFPHPHFIKHKEELDTEGPETSIICACVSLQYKKETVFYDLLFEYFEFLKYTLFLLLILKQ